METEQKRIPFDWEKYQSGEYEAVCRDGRKDIIIGAYNPNAKDYKLAAWVESELYCYTENGLINKEIDYTTQQDLFLIPKPKKFQAWVNLYDNGNITYHLIEVESEKYIKFMKAKGIKCVETRLIEWEA
jgi:hypothetical protein